MQRQGAVDLFDPCPICRENFAAAGKKRIDVRAGVSFEICPACYRGILAHALSLGGSGKASRHPAKHKGRSRWPRPR